MKKTPALLAFGLCPHNCNMEHMPIIILPFSLLSCNHRAVLREKLNSCSPLLLLPDMSFLPLPIRRWR